jgi:hypothetical protein
MEGGRLTETELLACVIDLAHLYGFKVALVECPKCERRHLVRL